MRLKGKSALITGGASGFGAAIARTFAAQGACVTIMDLNGSGAAQVVADFDGFSIQGDVTKSSDINNAVSAAHKNGRAVDVVVNNAGWTHYSKPMLDVTEEECDRLYDINVRSIFHMSRAVVPIMRTQEEGVILNIGSTAGIRPRPGLT